jgi:Gas vesicle synthesis protein GvpL/GvpF
VSPTYVYGVVAADTVLPEGLQGLGPSGTVSLLADGQVAAVVGDVPADRPLGTRDDLVAHETVVDAVAGTTTILPMRFPAVIEEAGVVDELLGPNEEFFLRALADLEGRVQYTVKGRYEQDVVLREVLEDDEDLRALQEHVRTLPEDASYYDRVRLGELIVAALEQRREADAAELYDRLEAVAVAVVPHQPPQPEDVIDAALLIERTDIEAFGEAIEGLGEAWSGRIRFRLLGPLAPYDFVSSDTVETGV